MSSTKSYNMQLTISATTEHLVYKDQGSFRSYRVSYTRSTSPMLSQKALETSQSDDRHWNLEHLSVDPGPSGSCTGRMRRTHNEHTSTPHEQCRSLRDHSQRIHYHHPPNPSSSRYQWRLIPLQRCPQQLLWLTAQVRRS